jgi:putative ABC transport system permease protein
MIAVALRSMAQRKLRSALTAVAILLGVAMIAGTYVQTDQIRTAMNDITRTANSASTPRCPRARRSPAPSAPTT